MALGDMRDELGREVAREICEAGGEAIFVHLDVASEESWQKAIAATVERFGKLDILVNNAGITASGGVLETTVETWDRIMDVNAKGVFLGTKVAIPEMRKAGGGSIVNISSQMGLGGQRHGQSGLQRVQGGGAYIHQVGCLETRQGGDTDQFRPPRAHRHAHAKRRICGPESGDEGHSKYPHGPAGRAG